MDVRYVKVWYQGQTAWRSIHQQPGRKLVPELLLHDDSLVLVNAVAKDNYIKVTRNGRTEYLSTTEIEKLGVPGDPRRMPVESRHYVLDDADHPQPLSLPADFTKQLWLQFIIPDDIPPGQYTGAVAISCDAETSKVIPVAVRVHSFDLLPPSIRYGIYYRGKLHTGPTMITSEQKTAAQMTTDLQAIYDVGIRYPTVYQSLDDTSGLGAALDLRNEIGYPSDEAYYVGAEIAPYLRRNNRREIHNIVRRSEALFARKGYPRLAFYAVDEGDVDVIREQLPGWALVRTLGHSVMVAGRKENLGRYPAAADLYVSAYKPDLGFSALVHKYGNRVYSYANPQGGVEDPLLYRTNYGIELWRAKYDGALIYAYQDMRGVAWSDFDGQYRDHFLVYPTTGGYVPTLAWEGLREAIYDTRYLQTLDVTIDTAARFSGCPDVQREVRLAQATMQAASDGEYQDLDKMRVTLAARITDLTKTFGQCLSANQSVPSHSSQSE